MSSAAEEATALNTSDLLRLIDAQFEEATATRVSGTIAADERHYQPWGLIHGGLYTAAIETFATIGAFQAVGPAGRRGIQRHRLPALAPLGSATRRRRARAPGP